MTPLPERGLRASLAFAAALALLLAVATWWLVFLTHHVRSEHEQRHEVLRLHAELHALRVARHGAPEGVLAEDPRFEVGPPRGARLEARASERLAVRPTVDTLVAEERRFDRRRLMVFGEGTLLLATALTCVLALWRLVRVERARRGDVLAFVSRVTDEVRAPLREVTETLVALREPSLDPERRREAAVSGLRALEREEHLVDAILTAQRLRSGVSSPPAPLDLARALRDFAAHRRTTFPGDTIEVECPDDLRATASEAGLHAILEGLLDDAERRGAQSMRLSARADGARVVLDIAHDGTGAGEEPRLALSIAEGLAREMRAALRREPGRSTLELPRS